jgi:Predicted signal transduction protein with a C-terminal ATPase domain
MFNKTMSFLKNLKIRYKILVCMVIITTVSLLFISLLSYNYFVSTYEKDAKSGSQYTLDVTSVSFRNHMNSILLNTSIFLSAKPMLDALKDISISNKNAYLYNYGNVQDDLERLIQSDVFIDNIVIIGKSKEFFALSKYGLNHDISNYTVWDEEHLSGGISLLPIRKSPLLHSKDVIPVVLPISQLSVESFTISPIVSGTVADSIASVYILLDANQINGYFKDLNKNPNSTLYLANEKGEPISLLEGSEIKKIAVNSDVISHIKSTNSSMLFDKSIKNDVFFINSESVETCNLNIVSVISKSKLLEGINTIKTFIFAAWVLSFLLTLVLSFVLSQFITRPLVSLMDVVKNIKNGTYTHKKVNKYNDEIGILIQSTNSMYDTIQQQIEVITQDEQEKAKAEIKVLAEQINPHFIYNTLDCIRWEILGENIESSAAMVESLGEFLRIALNYGSAVIPIKQELKHTTEYMNIINHRSNQQIAFRYNLDEHLEDFQVVKLILQPLVENSIKHGFGTDISDGIILSPFIEINISLKDDRVIFEVIDNGRGIDINRANTSLYQLDTKVNQVGLNNIYNRLRLYYGNSISITFNTTPYYRSSVIVDIPYSIPETK